MVAAFAAVYVIWGSTYLAIRYAIETLPPFSMAGIRFVMAGAVLYAWSRLRGDRPPEPRHWWVATVIGALLLVGGNGAVVWAEQRVPSGITALLAATVPLWMVVLDRDPSARGRTGAREAVGLGLGFVGLVLLVGTRGIDDGDRVDPLGAAVLIAGSIAWSVGSLYSRRARLPESVFLATAMEMLTGGALLLALGLLSGEGSRFDPARVSARSIAAFAYLVVFGALIGFTAYLWLMRVASPARVSTYAYVNPVVAMFLGWTVAGEPLSARTILATVVIVAAVLLVLTKRPRISEDRH